MRLRDRYKSLDDFEEILEDARMGASSDKEEGFVSSVKSAYSNFGGSMFWSDAQDRWLRDIAGPEDY